MFRQGNYEKSLNALRELARVFPDDKTVLYATALCLERLERRVEAVRLCDRLVREHHYDKAVILKARLITTPSDPPPGANEDEAATICAWPTRADILKTEPERHQIPTPTTAANFSWIAGMGIVVCAFLALLPVLIIFFAQADTTVPGALPTLFPGRVVIVYGITLCSAISVIIFCVVIVDHNVSISPRRVFLGATACGGLVALLPGPGWLAAVAILYKGFGLSLLKSTGLVVVGLGVQLIAVAIILYTLDITSIHSVYMELRAGYG